MSDTDIIAMGTDERDAFLGTGGTGVISVSSPDDEPPYSAPVSYGYDASTTTFYFSLAAGHGSDREPLASRSVTFVVHGHHADRWQSVIATGRLEETTEPSISTESLAGLENVHIPLIDIFDRPVRETTFEFYRLVPDELTCRKESTTTV